MISPYAGVFVSSIIYLRHELKARRSSTSWSLCKAIEASTGGGRRIGGKGVTFDKVKTRP